MGHLILTVNTPLQHHHSSCSIHNFVLISSSPITHPSTYSPPTRSLLSSNNYGTEKKTRLWRSGVSFLQLFSTKSESIKQELLELIAPLDRGTPMLLRNSRSIARKLEAVNKIKEPLKSDLLNGKWELLYTTSQSILQTKRPKILRANGKIYQAINVDTLRAQNMETWPFFNQATANLVPLNNKQVAVKFDAFKVFGLIPIKARGSGRGQLEITYLDEELRISRGNEGNLFILRMVDPTYRVPL
ncbi:putative plastid-lipid-associated protein [Helianthus anomalus]